MVIVHARWVPWVHAGAVTLWPFMFIPPGAEANSDLVKHEGEHGRQQLWFLVTGALVGALVGAFAGLPVQLATIATTVIGTSAGAVGGLALWCFLYLCCLPVGWNPFRAWAERRAYRAEGYLEEDITRTLRQAPYYLWWM